MSQGDGYRRAVRLGMVCTSGLFLETVGCSSQIKGKLARGGDVVTEEADSLSISEALEQQTVSPPHLPPNGELDSENSQA